MNTHTQAAPVAVTPFNFRNHSVRVVMRDGDPWFVAKDVCIALGYRDTEKGTRILGPHQKGMQIVRTLGGEQTVTIINESGLYRLVLRSRKPEAVAFSDWVTGEVLPTIRKTGSYGTPAVAGQPEMAHQLATEAAAHISKNVFAAALAGSDGHGWTRYMLTYSQGDVSVKQLPMTASIIDDKKIAAAIADDAIHLDDEDIIAIIKACADVMLRRTGWQRHLFKRAREHLNELKGIKA